jgi:hypothetical protein
MGVLAWLLFSTMTDIWRLARSAGTIRKIDTA